MSKSDEAEEMPVNPNVPESTSESGVGSSVNANAGPAPARVTEEAKKTNGHPGPK